MKRGNSTRANSGRLKLRGTVCGWAAPRTCWWLSRVELRAFIVVIFLAPFVRRPGYGRRQALRDGSRALRDDAQLTRNERRRKPADEPEKPAKASAGAAGPSDHASNDTGG